MSRSHFRLMKWILILMPILVGCAKPDELATHPPLPTFTKLPPTPSVEPSPTIRPTREPVSAVEVQDIASAFETITSIHAEAWNTYDFETMQALYNDNIEFIDASFGDHLIGKEKIIEMARGMASDYSSMRRKIIDHFIGLDDSVATYDYWGVFEFTPDNPFFNALRFKTQDNRFTTWTLYEGLEAADRSFIGSRKSRDEARLLLANYLKSWSSGDPAKIAALYSSDAVRTDSLFRDKQEGQEAIADFSKTFYAWYPDVKWSHQQSFGEWQGDSPTIGGTYSITVKDSANQPCEVLMIVLIKTYAGKIVQEDIYYQPDSLIHCGWAK